MTDDSALDEEMWGKYAASEGMTLDDVYAIKRDMTAWEEEIKQNRARIESLNGEYEIGAATLKSALARLRESQEAQSC